MFAILKTGGKQYKVSQGSFIDVERFKESNNKGDIIVFNDVLLVKYEDNNNVLLGNPTLENISIEAEVIGVNKDKKVISFKKRRRKNSSRTIGHRQQKLRVRIKNINL